MNRHSFFNRAAGAIVLLMLSSAAPVNAQGLLYTVNSTGDGGNVGSSSFCDDGTGHCTLRAALEAANAHPGTDGIRFNIPTSDPGYNGVFWTINLTRVLPDVSDSASIIGPGANLLTVRPNSMREFRIFNVTTAGVVTFSKMTISNGFVFVDGGGIANSNSGTVNITTCTLSGSQAVANAGAGGGIANLNDGTISITNSTISGNAAGQGGGISNFSASGTLNVTNSTVANNVALIAGGGIHNNGTLNVTNSTISGNSVTSGRGGGIVTENNRTVNITNSTISGNSCRGSGGGINGIDFGTVHIRSTIIAGNTAGISSPDVRGAYQPSGFNLIGINDGAEASFPTGNPNVNNDIVGTAASPVDPKLDPAGLRDNGGPTETIALRSDSPAIDKGTSIGLSGTLSTDQRGATFPRTFDYRSPANAAGGDGTDIGAFELMLKMDFIAKLANGHILLQGTGIPNRLHTIQASPNLSPNSFTAIGTPTADETGALQYDDAAAVGLEKRFYRLAFP